MIPVIDTETGLVTLHDGLSVFGPYRMRGAVCMPCLTLQTAGPGRSLSGVVLVAGQKSDGKVDIFLEGEFNTIAPTVIDGRLTGAGATTLYNRAWTDWMCRQFFVHQSVESWRMHIIELKFHGMAAQLVPAFIAVPWKESQTAESSLWGALNAGTLTYPPDGLTHKALQRYTVNPKEPDPAAWAAMVLTCGAAMFPVRA